jgi:hypothetical protein
MMIKPSSFLPIIPAADPENFSLFFFFLSFPAVALAKFLLFFFSSHFSAVSAPFSLFFSFFFLFFLLSFFCSTSGYCLLKGNEIISISVIPPLSLFSPYSRAAFIFSLLFLSFFFLYFFCLLLVSRSSCCSLFFSRSLSYPRPKEILILPFTLVLFPFLSFLPSDLF